MSFEAMVAFGLTYDTEQLVDVDEYEIPDPTPSPLDVLIAAEALAPRTESPAEKAKREGRIADFERRSAKLAEGKTFRINSSDELRWDREIARIRTAAHKVCVIEPCVICGSTDRIERHHESYLAPLDVICLCPLHHRRRHVRLKKSGRCPYLAYFAARRAGASCPPEGEDVRREYRTKSFYRKAPDPSRRCSQCRQFGHNRTTCGVQR